MKQPTLTGIILLVYKNVAVIQKLKNQAYIFLHNKIFCQKNEKSNF